MTPLAEKMLVMAYKADGYIQVGPQTPRSGRPDVPAVADRIMRIGSTPLFQLEDVASAREHEDALEELMLAGFMDERYKITVEGREEAELLRAEG